MDELERKVREGLGCCVTGVKCAYCPYADGKLENCRVSLMLDALQVLDDNAQGVTMPTRVITVTADGYVDIRIYKDAAPSKLEEDDDNENS